MKTFRVETDFSALSQFNSISRRLGARSLLQLLRGQPIQQEWVEDYVFRATPRKGLVWPDYYDFGGGLILVSHKLKSRLSSFCKCSPPTYQFLSPNWDSDDVSAFSVGYSILNVLDMRPDALLSHHDRIGLNRSGQLDAKRSTLVDSTKVSGCDHLVRLSASLIIAVDTLAISLAEGDLIGFRLTELSCDAPDVIETEPSDEPKSRSQRF